MARRRRLTPAQPGFLTETPASLSGLAPLGLPPIAQVAAEASATAALREVSDALQSLRADSLRVQRLPLDALDTDYLVRDRIALDDDELQTLIASLRARGQQTPVEVVALPEGRYGLISGWRRLTALRHLRAETGDAAFGTVLALIRQPEGASDAYLAMVEENEIRVGLSYYERARIAARAAELGVFASPQLAVRHLFASASRAKRSKIMSFLGIHAALDAALRFPSALSERAGLVLARALEQDAGLAGRLRDRLRKAAPRDAESELAVLLRAAQAGAHMAAPGVDTPPGGSAEPPAPPPEDAAAAGVRPMTQNFAGIMVRSVVSPNRVQVTLSGAKATPDLHDRMMAWLATQG